MKLCKVWILLVLSLLLFAGVLSHAATTTTSSTKTPSTPTSSNKAATSGVELSALQTQIQQLSKDFENYKKQVDSLEDRLIARLEKELDDRDYMKAACDASKLYWEKTVDFVKNLHDEAAKRWPGIRDEGLRLWNLYFTEAKTYAKLYSDRIFDELVLVGLTPFQAEIAVGVVWALAAGIALLVVFTLLRLVFRITFYFLCCRFCRRSSNTNARVKQEPSAPTAQVPRSAGGNKRSPGKAKKERN